MSGSIITELSCLTRQILFKFCQTCLALHEISPFQIQKKRPQPAPPGCGLSTSATAETATVLSFRRQLLQNCNHWQDKSFSGRPSACGGAKNSCENDKSSADNSNRRRPRSRRGRPSDGASWGKGRHKIPSHRCPTNN